MKRILFLVQRIFFLILFVLLFLEPLLAFAQTSYFTRGVAKSVPVTPTVTASTTNYTAGDCIGGKQTVSSIFPTFPGSGQDLFVELADQGAEGRNVDVIVFHTDPSASTFTDNSPCTIADADLSKVACVIELRTHYALYDNGLSQGFTSGCVAVAGGVNFYAVAVARESGYYYDATNALTFVYNAVQD